MNQDEETNLDALVAAAEAMERSEHVPSSQCTEAAVASTITGSCSNGNVTRPMFTSRFIRSSAGFRNARAPAVSSSSPATTTVSALTVSPDVRTVSLGGARVFHKRSSSEALASSQLSQSKKSHTHVVQRSCVQRSCAEQSAQHINDLPDAPPPDVRHLSRAMALLQSPTKGAEGARVEGPDRLERPFDLLSSAAPCISPCCSSATGITPAFCWANKTFGNGTQLTVSELKAIKSEQRSSTGLYKPEFFFPTTTSRHAGSNLTDEDRLDRQSLRRAERYVCIGTYGCKIGDCLAAFQSSDIAAFRTATENRRMSSTGVMTPWKQLMMNDLQHCWNRTTSVWEPVNVSLDQVNTVKICVVSYGLLCGCAPSTLRDALTEIKSSIAFGGALCTHVPSTANPAVTAREQRTEDWCMLRSYVANLLDQHEAVPAPGAHQPGRMTHISKQTWKVKWRAAQAFFKDAPRVPGSKSMLKNVWKLETRLKEKKACAHSKCNICSKADTILDSLRGVNTEAAKVSRANAQRAIAEHEEMHLAMRTELDAAGLQSFTDPRSKWTLLADAATQRNFMLPKFKFRTPKKLAGKPFWSYKLMATYAYGYGFSPFLVHNSQTMGANLTWTVLWLTLTAMYKHYGFWPEEMHLTVDNTTGENKNETLLAMCAWLVSSGKVKRVRVLFLMVGHTHIIIDHIFGVVTVGLRRKELLVPEDLVRNITASLAANPQYMAKPVQVLHCLWDFSQWCVEQMKPVPITRIFKGNVQDEVGGYSGMYDLAFACHGTGLATLKYREHCSHPWLPEASTGAEIITMLPQGPPPFQKLKKWDAWAKVKNESVHDTIIMCLEFARSLGSDILSARVQQMWQKHFDEIPNTIEMLRADLRLSFEFFVDRHEDVLRIGMQNDTVCTEGIDEGYEEWKRQNIAIRTGPLGIDPVVSSAQSAAEFATRKAAMQAAIRTDPNPTVIASSAIFLGDYVLAASSPNASGVSLFNVVGIDGSQSVSKMDLHVRAVEYEHLPNSDIDGLFGTFKMRMLVVDGQVARQQERKMIHRSQIKVFNVQVLKKKNVGSVLSIRTLRALALAMPESYPFPKPASIPDSHVEFSDGEDDGQQREQPCSVKASRGRGRGRGRSATSVRGTTRARATRAVSSSDEDSDSSSQSSSQQSEPSSEASGESSDMDCTAEGAADVPPAAVPPAAVPPAAVPPATVVDDPVLLLEAPSVKPPVDKVIALNMVNDPEYLHFKYPFALVYVRSAKPFTVFWFVVPDDQLVAKARNGQARDFKMKSGTKEKKFLTLQKFWSESNWWKGKAGTRPTEDAIMKYWYSSTAHTNWILPIDIPQSDAQKVKMTDSFRMEISFLQNSLIPVCKAASCVHK